VSATVKVKRISIAAILPCQKFLSADSPRPKQDGKHNRPDNAPPDPGDIRVSGLPLKDSFVHGHRGTPRVCSSDNNAPVKPRPSSNLCKGESIVACALMSVAKGINMRQALKAEIVK
jgi:hypothetical protein